MCMSSRHLLTAARSVRPPRQHGGRMRYLSIPRRHSSSQTHGESSVNPDEIALFSRLSSQWWDEAGEFRILHKMNPVRMQFIREKLIEVRRDERDSPVDEESILQELSALDVGCGGGLLCESLARLGAHAVGVDASSSNIAIASLHASADPSIHLNSASPIVSTPSINRASSRSGKGSLSYEHTSVEDLLARRGPKQFDVVCSMEVLEHVDNPKTFLSNCAQLVKPGGHLFLSTIARTPLAYFLNIFAVEQLFRVVTPGTHTYSKFINPDELVEFFHGYRPTAGPSENAAGVAASRPWIARLYDGRPSRTEAETRGIIYLPWKGEWTLVPRSAPGAKLAEGSNYLFWVRRPLDSE